MAMELNFESVVSMIENMITGVGVFELKNGEITPVYLNEGLGRMLGYTMQETKRAFKNVRNSIIPDDLPVLEQAIIDVLRDDGAVDFELRTVTLTGGMRWLQVRANLYARQGDTYTVIAVLMDATERKNVEEELRQQVEHLHLVAAAEGEMIFDYNAKTDVMMIRDAAETINRTEMIFNNYFSKFDDSFIHKEDTEIFLEVFKGALKSPKHDTVEIRTNRYDGEYKWYQCSITSIAGVDGYVTRIVGRIINIDERKKKEMDLKVKAEKDALTGIYNKGAAEHLIRERLETDCRGTEEKLHALMIIDLDNFKEVNDILGHAKGDEVLKEAATKILTSFKGSDIVGRIGGDEFTVLMCDIGAISNTDILATRLCNELKKSIPSEYGEIIISASIGISIFPYHGTEYSELFEKADKALYTAKANGKDGYRIFDAAATIAYHANRKKDKHSSVNAVSPVRRTLEDMVMQILFENKGKKATLSSVLELITSAYGMQRAFICSESDLTQENERDIRFLAEGYEVGKETTEQRKRRLDFCKSLSTVYESFSIIHQYDELTDDARSFFVDEGIRCLLFYPFYREGLFLGAIIFENHIEDDIVLTDEKINELRCIFRIINACILQDSFIGRVQNSVAQIQMLDNMDNYVYLVDADSYQINFVNRKVLLTTPEVHIGEYCFRAFANSASPCENCIMKQLDRQNHHAQASEERFNYSLRTWTKASACWLECNEEFATCMLNCMDISDYLT